MSCTGAWVLKAKNRIMKISVTPTAGSNPTLIELGLRILDLSSPPTPTVTDAFSATQLAAGVEVALQPGRRYQMVLITMPVGVKIAVTIGLNDEKTLVDNETCTRGTFPVTGDWTVTTRKTN